MANYGYYHSDPTADVAIGRTAKDSKKKKWLSAEEERHATAASMVEFYTRAIKGAKPADCPSAVIKALGTYAEIDAEASHTGRYDDHSDEVREILSNVADRFSNSKEDFINRLMNWFYDRRNDLRNRHNAPIRPIIMKVSSGSITLR